MAQKRKNTTFMLTTEEAKAGRNWILVDAAGKTLGRFASEVATILRGKHKPTFTPHIDCGDGVIIVNADKIIVSGSKEAQKIYSYYTGKMSGLREIPYRVMMDKKPEYIIEHAVKGMLPKNKMRAVQMKRLRIFAKEAHNMEAQKPIVAAV